MTFDNSTLPTHADTAEALSVSQATRDRPTNAFAREKNMLMGYAPARAAGANPIPKEATPRQAFAAANADFTVEKRPLTYMGRSGEPSTSKCVSIVRTDTHQEVGVTGPNYPPFQMEYVMRVFDFLREDATIDNIMTFGHGEKVVVTASLNLSEEVTSGDPIFRFIHAYNSFDGSTGFGFHFSDMRWICSNQMRFITGKGGKTAAKEGRGIHWKHSKSAEQNLEALPQLIDLEQQRFHKGIEELRRLPGKHLSREAATAILERTYADKLAVPIKDRDTEKMRPRTLADLPEIDRIRALYGGQGIGIEKDIYGFFNAITQFETHEQGRAKDETARARARLESLWGGQGAGRIERAREACLSFA
jgi:hypothetical protein